MLFNYRITASFVRLLHFAALQLVSSPDRVFARATPDSEAHLPIYKRLHNRRDKGAQEEFGSLSLKRLHRLLPEQDPTGGDLDRNASLALSLLLIVQSVDWFSALAENL